jgi:ketosteroid isomerase-like protein
MKIRLLLTLAGLAIGYAVPAFAQQTKTPDPQLRDAFVAFVKKFDDAFLNGDAAAAAACYTEDACYVDPTAGAIYGREAIEKFYADLFKTVHFIKHLSTPEQYSPHTIGTAGNEIWTTGEWSATFQVQNAAPVEKKGHWLDVDVREGDAWKFRVNTWNVLPPPAPAETK